MYKFIIPKSVYMYTKKYEYTDKISKLYKKVLKYLPHRFNTILNIWCKY